MLLFGCCQLNSTRARCVFSCLYIDGDNCIFGTLNIALRTNAIRKIFFVKKGL
jgi:hypothetical protein